ncbi:uncharacterized protein LOC107625519 isoform X2 [Arachis ipaensis]|nr:uncharacterized protein LOC107625519 isoform X2 [Arachis ipaensis]XP_020971684.1 uncharacterized protein LOC107625519 isoform X2 [Arachis ipaensis]XP_025633343.1 uncharacterized protein LOC112727694 isoform X2 [Arachis hypogaea]XP_025633344.1 uncharacterized protein LOC112727694 isoform X2 [Arachis hypogaea]
MTQWNRLLILCCSLLSHKSPGSPKLPLTIVVPSSSLHSSRCRCLLLPGVAESLCGVAASPLSEASPLLHGVLASPLFCFYLVASASLSWLIIDCASLHWPFVGCHLWKTMLKGKSTFIKVKLLRANVTE